ncbi:hypothetical protein AAFF_G00261990 [Aldrovandia affinis]|uniref:Uncharacterized protein n=1 Tax=Aldrovandia affinis TaxID=143900 RepID=A0AAD7SSP6_9TELE|nr:hypothetical protein AAFF_G00261990 [Aldrovandia affinis]
MAFHQRAENFPNLEGQLCTDVTSEQLNQLLGSIMKIVVNNLGIDEASWMKRLASQRNIKGRSWKKSDIFLL